VGILEKAEDHFEPAPVRSVVIIAVCAAAVGLLLVWVWLSQLPALTKTMLTGAVTAAAFSAFIAGNTYRLHDVRKRVGNQVRAGQHDQMQALAKLPPRETIGHRFAVAGVGTALACLVLVLAIVYARTLTNGVQMTVAVSVLGLVACALCFVGGSWVRPVD
jgi:hypothetical protein